MAKQGQHKNDLNDQTKSKGRNRPSQSMDMTTGSYKKPETYRAEAMQGKATNKPGQMAKSPGWNEHPGHHTAPKFGPGRGTARSGRTGSQSNAS